MDRELFDRARFGDSAAFEALARPVMPTLRGVVRRFIGDPDDTNDLVQDALLRAYEKVGSFRGESSFSTWLISIATRLCLDYLRKTRRWRADAQVHVREHLHATPEHDAELQAMFDSPEHRFDAREHIAFCFTCVGRSLDAEEHAALVLRDIFEYSNREAAAIVGLTESALRHRLAAARAGMQQRFDGLCGIVSKTGVCYQCEGLRDRVEPERQGPAVPTLGESDTPRQERYRLRLRVVRDGDVDAGTTQPFHDRVWRAMSVVEQ